MRKKLAFIAPTLLGALLLTACGDNTQHSDRDYVTISDNSGSVEVIKEPANLVVLDTSTLDILTLFDYKIAGIPQTGARYPAFMQAYSSDQYFNAGGFFEPDFERINAAQPELIITGGRALDAAPELRRIAPTIDLGLQFGAVVQGIERQLTALGEITQQQQQAEDLKRQFSDRIQDVRAQGEQAGSAVVVMLVGGRMSAYGEGSRFGFIYDELGFTPALELENRGTHGNPMSFELLLRTDPDWIFVLSRDQAIGTDGAQNAQQIMDNELVAQTQASQNDRVVYLDSSAIYIAGGYNAYMQLMDQVEAAIQTR